MKYTTMAHKTLKKLYILRQEIDKKTIEVLYCIGLETLRTRVMETRDFEDKVDF